MSCSEGFEGVEDHVTMCNVGERRVKGSVTSRTSHLREGTIGSQILLANSLYVARRVGLEHFRTLQCLISHSFLHYVESRQCDNRHNFMSFFVKVCTTGCWGGYIFVTLYLMGGPE